jgi:putative Mn2+ efflux pump MntP
MTPLSIAVLSLSMSTDAFAAAVGRGAANRPPVATAIRNGLVFGVIEAITPLIGWGLGLLAAGFVEQVDHWIAFGLLGAVGAKMLWEAFQPIDEDDDGSRAARNGVLALIATAIGTSIDAAAVGVVLTTIGMLIGKAVGRRFGKAAEFVGGVALIVIGASILAEHMGWLG